MNKKKKSTNTSPYPDEVIDRLARAFYPAILACWNSEEGQREFAAWQAEQAHHTTSKEKQSVPDGERPAVHIAVVCGFWQGASGWAHPVFLYKKNLLVWLELNSTKRTRHSRIKRMLFQSHQILKCFLLCRKTVFVQIFQQISFFYNSIVIQNLYRH